MFALSNHTHAAHTNTFKKAFRKSSVSNFSGTTSLPAAGGCLLLLPARWFSRILQRKTPPHSPADRAFAPKAAPAATSMLSHEYVMGANLISIHFCGYICTTKATHVMKPALLFSALLSLMVSCSRDNSLPAPAPPAVTKTVVVSFAQDKDYSAPIFDGVEAELRLSIARVNKQSGATVVLWDTLLPYRPLRQYPAMHQPWRMTKQVSVQEDHRESITASYSIRYRDALNQQSMRATNDFAGNGSVSFSFHAGL